MASSIDTEVRKLITQAHEEARQILTTHEDALHRLAAALIERETLDGAEIAEVLADVSKWEHVEAGALRIRPPETNGVTDGYAAAGVSNDDPQPVKP